MSNLTKREKLEAIKKIQERMNELGGKLFSNSVMIEELYKNGLLEEFVDFLISRLSNERMTGFWIGLKTGIIITALLATLIILIF